MKYLNRLLRVEVSAILALLICSILTAAYGYIDKFQILASGIYSILTPPDAAWLMFGYTITFGILPTVLLGAPLYALVNYSNAWLLQKSIAIGIFPGIFLHFVDKELGIWVFICGFIVSYLTHLINCHIIKYWR